MNQTASLISPVYQPSRSQKSCLRLAVHLHGADMGSLELGQFPEERTQEREVLGRLTGSFQDAWQTFLVDLIPVNQTFQLYLEARVGPSYLSDIAVDDVELLEVRILLTVVDCSVGAGREVRGDEVLLLPAPGLVGREAVPGLLLQQVRPQLQPGLGGGRLSV